MSSLLEYETLTPADAARAREEWVAEVERFIAEVEVWAARRQWGTLREPREIKEGPLGTYVVPRLLVHASFGRTIVEPGERFIIGAEGRADIFAMPSWDGLILIRQDGAWTLLKTDADGERLPWTEEVFEATVRGLHGVG